MALVSIWLGVSSAALTLIAAYFQYMYAPPDSSSYETAFYGSVALLLFAALLGILAIALGVLAFIKARKRWVAVVGVLLGFAPLLMLAYPRLIGQH